MKRKWLKSSFIISVLGSGVYLSSKFLKRYSDNFSNTRKEIITQFQDKGYTVHCYNENNDFILFNSKINEKRHVFWCDDTISNEEFENKMQVYYFHFTNEFFFIANDSDTINKTKERFLTWKKNVNKETIKKYGEITGYFHTYKDLSDVSIKIWSSNE
jgi:hypothetical protein